MGSYNPIDNITWSFNFDWPKLEIVQLKQLWVGPFKEHHEALFKFMPALRSLYLTDCMMSMNFLRRLTQMQGVWPKLERLLLEDTYPSHGDLTLFLVSRTRMNSNQGLLLHIYIGDLESVHFLSEDREAFKGSSHKDQLEYLMEAFPGVIQTEIVTQFDDE
ncbi:hypothetical protein M422DRAFT_249431 [Sphaerobolus stellatus SS14]|uniref:Uncharacterized protein n=1 Tax=Sphaerobolus stellatus (strain SS14) TaxID=990650 RepID=A0A0C9UVR6_SPHS4|nr:hypothetical protein M422DRAFT_249430 [Sphaerobolus stellatus SS14]KIJ47120.1 hypothetical protein M422DRAFT_249431 [Sphaerobolus stellatus SS14]